MIVKNVKCKNCGGEINWEEEGDVNQYCHSFEVENYGSCVECGAQHKWIEVFRYSDAKELEVI